MQEDATPSIVQIKIGISVRNCEEQIRACQESGKTVKEWCGENGIPVGTYYSRLRRIRETALTEEQRAFPCDGGAIGGDPYRIRRNQCQPSGGSKPGTARCVDRSAEIMLRELAETVDTSYVTGTTGTTS